MLGRREALVAGLACAATLAGCFADLAALSSGNAAPADAAPESSATDGDAALESGAAAADGAADGGVDASPTSFCASAGPHTLCEDFDTPIVAGFSVVDDFGGGAGAKDTTQASSPPASFRLTTPALAAAHEAWLLPSLAVPKAAKHVHVEAKVQPCADGGDYVFLSVNNSASAGGAYGAIDVGIHPITGGFETYMVVKHDTFSKIYALGPVLPSTRFTHLALDTDIDKTSGTVKLAIDGVVVVDAKNISTDQSGTVASRSAWAGLYSYQSPACTAHVDDIIIDVQ